MARFNLKAPIQVCLHMNHKSHNITPVICKRHILGS